MGFHVLPNVLSLGQTEFSTELSTPVEKGSFPTLALYSRPARRRGHVGEVTGEISGGGRVYGAERVPHKNEKTRVIHRSRQRRKRRNALTHKGNREIVFALCTGRFTARDAIGDCALFRESVVLLASGPVSGFTFDKVLARFITLLADATFLSSGRLP